MKKLISILLFTTMILSSLSLTSDITYADSPSHLPFRGSNCTSNSAVSSTIDYILAKYPDGSQYKGGGECYGWTEKISNMIAKDRSTKYYTGLKLTKKNFLAKCQGLKAGTHLRMSNGKSFDAWHGHSVCLLKVTKKKVYWTEANYGSYNIIAHSSGTPDDFINRYGYGYINAVTKTLSYKTQSEPLMTIKRNAKGSGTIYWTKTSNTSKYKVYRAPSKNGNYKLIKATAKTNFTDEKASLGKKYYYKVKALKKNGSKIDSSKKSFTAKLASPIVTSFTNENAKGRIQISWKAVKKANKYYVYRACANDSKPKFKYIAATSKTTYTDKTVTNPNKWYVYKVKAVYSKNTKGSSPLSDEYGYFQCALAAPTLSHTYDSATNTLAFKWNKSAYAKGYGLYYRSTADDYTMDYGYVTSIKTKFDVSLLNPGETYQFYVVAFEDEYDYYWSEPGSIASNVITFTAPAQPEPADSLPNN